MEKQVGYILMYKEKNQNSAYFCVDITKSENKEFHSSLNGFIIKDKTDAENLLKLYSEKFSNLEFRLVN
jgi:hypothetical protein